ncbi:DUF421 domain-containing protein [Petroclostridium sp. X23]|uniref:DUF421 domain-containing protein n=1 Tax=Petroclostridium sp. X23 TaxID=3045146 RepID=UPI0024AE274F|nr:DUF421 domain-containing protein [Petroclostridium sp. X23]WHH57693.1 DUF421 domain-containing protein [Petroclostridium sp. X23]
MDTVINSMLRAVFAYLLLMVVARLMGRKAIAQMTFFDFAVAITLGSVTANLALGPKASAASATATLITLAALAILTGYIHIKSFKGRKLIDSEPVTVIKNGQIVNENMKKIRFTIDDLTSLLREKNMFNVADVEFAILESDGKISVLPKSQKQPLTPSDLNISTGYKGLTKDLVIDGSIMYENLQDIHLNEQWLRDELEKQNIVDVSEVFYAGLDTSGTLYVSKKSHADEKEGQYGIE